MIYAGSVDPAGENGRPPCGNLPFLFFKAGIMCCRGFRPITAFKSRYFYSPKTRIYACFFPFPVKNRMISP